MKKLLFVACLFFFVGTVGLIVSCDKVEGPYMNVVDIPDSIPTFPAFPAPMKTVLIEEFTGHFCVYCPTGADYIHQIQQQTYGSRVIVLAIHSSTLAIPDAVGDYALDLRSIDHGETLYTDFLVSSEPSAMFNREKLDGTNIIYSTTSTWQSKVEEALAVKPVLSMQIINQYDSATRKLFSFVRTRFDTVSTQNLRIAVYISEDSIIGFQKNNNTAIGTTPDITDYVFMDVLRDEFVGTYGETFTNGGVAKDSIIIRSYSKTLSSSWVDKHCKVVAYVFVDNGNAPILQAVERKVIE